MIRLLVLALITSPICSRPGYRSRVMYGSKPILRLGPIEGENEEAKQPENNKEPQWVSNLRTNIQKQINEAGFESAKPVIKELIQEANEEVNNDVQNNSDVPGPIETPLRSGYTSAWEKDLKSYIKELIATYGRNNLDSYVRPVINSIERAQRVIIKDIDVNPYGEVSVNYVRSGGDSYYPDPRMYQQRDGFEPGFTIAPE